MKKAAVLLSILFGTFIFSSCIDYRYHKTKKIPPGQAKKLNGSKSAKHYAPGQRNKKMRED